LFSVWLRFRQAFRELMLFMIRIRVFLLEINGA
jgi:hypothetical protein